jgi:hypothetical protein
MGSSSSKTSVTNTSNQTYINQTTVDIINKNTSEAVANALIKNNASCSTVNQISQNISFHGCKVAGDMVISNVKQDAMITVDFSCLNAFKAEQEMAQAMLSELVSDLQSKMDAKSLNDMNTKAETQAQSSGIGFLTGSSSSSSNVNNTYNLKVVNESNTAIQNVIANSVQSDFTVESIQECIAQNAIKQNQDYSNCEVGGNLTVSELEQKAGISTVVSCVNNSGTVQSVMNKAANEIGVVSVNDTEVTSTNKMVNDIQTVAQSIGLGSCVGCCGCDPASSTIVCVILILCCFSVCAFLFMTYILPMLDNPDSEGAKYISKKFPSKHR